jgi:hypothetical protein
MLEDTVEKVDKDAKCLIAVFRRRPTKINDMEWYMLQLARSIEKVQQLGRFQLSWI